ncbi:MAG: hypothetical protein WBC99_05885, partial [Candidatus Omnitrophota bacterium]
MLLTGEPFATYRRRIVLSVQNVREYLQQELPELRTLEQQLGAREQQLRTQGMRKDFESDPAYSLYKRNVIKKTAKIKKRVGALLKGESNDIFTGNRTALEILSAPVVEDVLELDAVERRRLDMIDLHRVTEGWSKDELRDLLRRTVKGRAQVDDHGRMRDINRIDDESALKRLIVENQGVSGPVYKHNFIPVIESSMKELAELERRRHNTRDDITRQLSSPRILRAGRWITGIGKTVSGWQKKISEQLDRWGERVDGWLRKIDYASEKDGVFSWSLKIAYYALAVITPISRAALKLALFLLRKVFKIAVVAAIVYGCMSYMPYALPYFIFMGNWTFLGMTASGALAVILPVMFIAWWARRRARTHLDKQVEMADNNRYNMKVYPVWHAHDKRVLRYFEAQRMLKTFQYGLGNTTTRIAHRRIEESHMATRDEAKGYLFERAVEEPGIGHTEGSKRCDDNRAEKSVSLYLDKWGTWKANLKGWTKIVTNIWIYFMVASLLVVGGMILLTWLNG